MPVTATTSFSQKNSGACRSIKLISFVLVCVVLSVNERDKILLRTTAQLVGMLYTAKGATLGPGFPEDLWQSVEGGNLDCIAPFVADHVNQEAICTICQNKLYVGDTDVRENKLKCRPRCSCCCLKAHLKDWLLDFIDAVYSANPNICNASHVYKYFDTSPQSILALISTPMRSC